MQPNLNHQRYKVNYKWYTHILRTFAQYNKYKLLNTPINSNIATYLCLYDYLRRLCTTPIFIWFKVDNLYTIQMPKRWNVACHVIASKMDAAYLISCHQDLSIDDCITVDIAESAELRAAAVEAACMCRVLSCGPLIHHKMLLQIICL